MAFLGQENFTPAAEEQRPARFLSLAPTTSASYPSSPTVKSPTTRSPEQAPTETANPASARARNATPAVPSATAINEALKMRRSSSLSSDGSSQKKRFLKLGPVHHGEDGGKGDWSEEVVDE
jgi:hypothetical protein